jgi:transglutaminase-like putative cysteine protease
MPDVPTPSRNDALTSIAAVSTVMVASLSFVPAVTGPAWWWTAAVFGAIGVLVAAAGRALRMPVVASGLLGVTALPLLAVLVAGGGAGVFVVLPTETAAANVMAQIDSASQQIYGDTVPAPSSPGLVLLLALGIGAACVLADTIAAGYRAPLIAMLVAVALAIVPGRALPIGTNAWLLLALAVGGLLLVVADRRRRGRRIRFVAITGAGAAAVVVALVAQVVLPAPPPADADTSTLSLFGSGVDPLIRLGDNLHRGANVPVLSYTTTSSSAQYLRLATLERFTGATWYPDAADDPVQRSPGPSGPIVAPLSTVSSAIAQHAVTTSVVPADASSVQQRLPIPYLPTTVRTTVNGLAWDDSGYTLARADTSQSVSDYSVSSVDVEPTAAQLDAITPSAPPGDSESLSLPRTVPASILAAAKSWTKGATTAYDKAVAIQDMLRSSAFTYDENTPVQDGYDGDGLSVIAKFLQVRAGYCVHFASTMAVMARLLGIPSRIVVGYQPTTTSTVHGRVTATVHSNDLHAWPELYFGSAGWVRFEPTPSRGSVPAYAPTSVGASPSATVTVTPTVTPSAVAPKPTQSAVTSAPRTSGSGSATTSSSPLFVGGGIALAVLVLLGIPGLARVIVRRRRRRRFGAPTGAAVGWREVLDTAADLRLSLPPGGSPRTVGAALTAAIGLDAAAGPALARLTQAYERQVFGARDAPVRGDDVADVRSALGRTAGRWARALAAVVPSSLLGTIKAVATGVRVVTTGERPTR